MTSGSSLRDILHPHEEGQFLAGTLGKAPLHIVGGSDKFACLPSWQEVNAVLSQTGIHPSRLRVIRGEEDLPTEGYSRAGFDGNPRLCVAELTDTLREGATLVIDSVEDLHEPTARLCRGLEISLLVPVRTQLCADWVEGPPRRMRWNDHDAFVLQLAGRKRWRVGEPTRAYPTASAPPPLPTFEATQDRDLSAGDLLYVPRGWWYTESSLQEAALFLAIKFRNPTGLDLISRLIDKLGTTDSMRADCPRFADMVTQGRYLAGIQREIHNACGEPGFFRDFLKSIQLMAQPRVSFGLPWSALPGALPPSEDFIAVPLPRFLSPDTVHHLECEDAVEILHNGRSLRFEEHVGPMLEELRGTEGVTVRELVGRCEKNAPRDQLLNSLSQLVKHGLVALRDPRES